MPWIDNSLSNALQFQNYHNQGNISVVLFSQHATIPNTAMLVAFC
jgi:hypothetical protein